MTDEEIKAMLEQFRAETRADMADIFGQQEENHREVVDTLNMLAQLVAEGQQRERQQIDNLWNVFQGLSEEVAGLRQILVRVSEKQRETNHSLDGLADLAITTDVGVMLAQMDIETVLARIKTIERALALLLYRLSNVAIAG